jgi:glycosyltransferase involved in cell wall biosynthesis
MRIAIAAHGYGQAGGVDRYLSTVIPALVDAGHEVACWFETADCAPADALSSEHGVPWWTAASDSARALAAVRQWRPDVVFTQGVASPDRERELLDVAPSVCFAHSYYGTCISGSKLHRTPTERCCTREFGPGCLLQYFPRRCGGWSPLTMMRQYELQHSRLDLLHRYDRIAVASRHMAEEYSRHHLDDKVRVVSLPIDSPSFQTGRSGDDITRLLYLGRLEETKGAHVAIESAALVAARTGRAISLQMSGEGSQRESLKERAATLMMRQPNLKVAFTGWLSDAGCVASLDDAHLLLVPSCWPEPFGMVGVEAALRGVPAVAFAVGGIPEWLTDGVNGKLVSADPPDAVRFADAIVACLADGPGFERMRERSRDLARRFSVDAHVTKLDALLREAVRSVRLAEARNERRRKPDRQIA